MYYSISASELFEVQVPVDELHAVVPEQDDFAFRDLLGAGEDEFDYIVEMSTQLEWITVTYLLLYATFLGLISSCLNQAKYNSQGATL